MSERLASKRYVVGTDIGGTFTDLVLLDRETGRIHVEKVLSNHDDPSLPIIQGVTSLVSNAQILMEDIGQIIHATTLATNALIERRGAVTGLISTRGHTDTIDLRSGARYDLYDLNIEFPMALVPRYLRKGVEERTHASGESLRKPDEKEVIECVKELVGAHGVESIAICLLHSYANPDHELIIERTIRENFPSLSVSTSSSVAPRISEHDRFNTTIVNAYVQPMVSKYIRNMESSLSKCGFSGQLSMMTCDGGLVDPDIAKQFPLLLLESGPVAGAQISSYVGNLAKLDRIFGFDMGGTTAKGCAIKEGVAEKDFKFEAARIHQFKAGSGITLLVPTVKLIEMGGGGGSIAWIDSRGTLQVGPKSAGSNPGPVCYGLGGNEPTVTDSDLVLGYLNTSYFLGGKMKLDLAKTKTAIMKTVGQQFNVDLETAAWAIYDKVAEDIAFAFRLHASERGADLRKYALTIFGGAGPVHGVHIAKKLGIKKVVVPLRAGVLSACGLLVVPPQFSLIHTKFVKLIDLDSKLYDASFSSLMSKGSDFLTKAGVAKDQIATSRKFDMRYAGQGFEIEVNDPFCGKFTDVKLLREAFEDRYEQIYLLRGVSESVEIASFKVTLTGPAPDVDLLQSSKQTIGRMPELKGFRDCYFPSSDRKHISTPVYDRYALQKGFRMEGPAIVEEKESTCVIPPYAKGCLDEWNNLIVELS